MKKLINAKNLRICLLAIGFLMLRAIPAFAASGGNGYGHPPIDTAAVGVTNETSLATGFALYTVGTIISSTAKILKNLIITL